MKRQPGALHTEFYPASMRDVKGGGGREHPGALKARDALTGWLTMTVSCGSDISSLCAQRRADERLCLPRDYQQKLRQAVQGRPLPVGHLLAELAQFDHPAAGLEDGVHVVGDGPVELV